MLRHPPTQRELLEADIDRNRDARLAALQRREEAVRVKVRAMAEVEQATAAITNAEDEAEKLAGQIDDGLDALAVLLEGT